MTEITPETLREDLAGLSASAARTATSGNKIHGAARSRLATVQKRMDELRPRVLTDKAAEDEYQALVEESGRLNIVLAEPSSRG